MAPGLVDPVVVSFLGDLSPPAVSSEPESPVRETSPSMNPPSMNSALFEPIAIIGTACRLPGDVESGRDVENPSELWEFLQNRKESYSDFPQSRLNVNSWLHPTTNRPGSFYTRGGAFLKSDPREFDPSFFGINPQEATSLDPAQRKFLEVVWEAVESSGTPMEKLSGTKTGCFVGNFNYDHQLMQYRDAEYPEPYSMTGGGIALLSNRVNYIFNLQGPSLTLDVACSASMYALHLACSSIQSGECTAAIVGGSNLILTPECQVFSSALGAVSKSSRCHTFDAAADGYARADGITVLFVKSLKQAIIDRDPIRAVIRGTAINANGRTGGITHPDPSGQEAVIRRAYERAGIDPTLTTYFECHGTGTPVGDPLEVEAVGRVFAPVKSEEKPLLIGSLKSNMGHPESASGVAAIIKVVSAIEQGAIPPIRCLNKLNPNVDLRSGKLRIVRESTPWPTTLRRASINSFGYGGANAHAILESVDNLAPGCAGVRAGDASRMASGNLFGRASSERAELSRRKLYLLPFSAHNERTLKKNIDALQHRVDQWSLLDVAFTLGCRRSQLASRSFLIAEEGKVHAGFGDETLPTYKALGSRNPTLGFVFCGQGAQWPQMGLQLMDSFPAFLRSIRAMDDILLSVREGSGWGIEEALRVSSDSSQVYRAELSQPLVTAVQVALVDLLRSWDIRPAVTVGHSSGEIAAAYASGRISAPEAILAAYARGQAVSRNTQNGAMLAVGKGAHDVAPFVERFPSVSIACYNSPESVTLSGDRGEIEELQVLLDAEGIFARVLATDGNAYHSSHMRALGIGYENDLNGLRKRFATVLGSNKLGSVRFISSVTGKAYTKPDISAQYWRQNLESPVLFHQALSKVVESCAVDMLLEIGPHTALQGPIRQIGKSMAQVKFPEYVPTLVRFKDGAENLLHTAGLLWAKGHSVNFSRVNSLDALDSITNSVFPVITGEVVVDLPRYQWQYGEQFYYENRWTREWRLRTHPRHDLLGSRVPGGNWNEPTWRNVLKHKDVPWLNDHKIGPDAVFPTTGYISMALEAATQMAEIKNIDLSTLTRYELHDLHLEAALVLPETGGPEIIFSLRSTRLNHKSYHPFTYDFTITSVVNSGENQDVFTEHAHGQIVLVFDHSAVSPPQELVHQQPEDSFRKSLSSSGWYDAFQQVGLEYGSTFRGLSNIELVGDSNSAFSQVNMAPTDGVMALESRYIVHPAALDSTLQLAIIAAHQGRASACRSAFLPVSVEEMFIWPSSSCSSSYIGVEEAAFATARTSPMSQELSSEILLSTNSGKQILRASNIRLTASEVAIASKQESLHPYARMIWNPDIRLATGSSLQALFPPRIDAKDGLSLLAHLALHQIVQFHAQYPESFATGHSEPHLQRLVSWMAEKVELARRDDIPSGVAVTNFSIEKREEEICRLEEILLQTNGPETRIMCHMYRSLPAILRGEITGIHAAVQDHLLDNLYADMAIYNEGSVALAEVVSLLSHKSPTLKIVEVGGGTGSATRKVLPALHGQDDVYRGYDTYTFTDIGTGFLATAQDSFKEYHGMRYAQFDMQTPVAEQSVDSDYDLVIASNVIHATTHILNTLRNIRSLLKPGGNLILFEFVQPRLSWNIILGTFSDFWNGDKDPLFPRTEGPFLTLDMWNEILPRAGFSGIDCKLDYFSQGEAAILLTTAVDSTVAFPASMPQPKEESRISVIYREKVPSSFVLEFCDHLRSTGASVDMIPLLQGAERKHDRTVMLVDVDVPLFTTVTSAEWEAFKMLVLNSRSALYVSRGDLLNHGAPEYSIMSGFVCAIHTEIPSSRLITVDLSGDDSHQIQDFENLVRLEEMATKYAPGDDFEYRSNAGVLYVSRMGSDVALNRSAQQKLEAGARPVAVPLFEFQGRHMIGSFDHDSHVMVFTESSVPVVELLENEIEIEVRAVDFSDQKFRGGCAGIVSRVGCAVAQFKPGDRVCGLAFPEPEQQQFSTVLRTPASFCQVLSDDDPWEQSATILSAFGLAVYALTEMCRLAPKEKVLIQSNSRSTGLAACQIARHLGAAVYMTEQMAASIGMSKDQVFCLTAVNGMQFDVILSDTHVHQHWSCMAPFGRFVHLGESDALDGGMLSMNVFQRGATFSTFNLKSLSQAQPAVVDRLVTRISKMRAAGSIQSLPTKIMSISDLSVGAQSVDDDDHVVATAVTFDSAIDTINVRPAPFETSFSPDVSYLLIGCLGGLGRSFAEWMVSQGARKLTFLSRAGATNKEATAFVSKLKALSVEVQILQGDVASLPDVERAVRSCPAPIKGVVQAALTLHDSFFSEMTFDQFQATMGPRVRGTLNLHEALKDAPLDFFVTWSSWTTLFGSTSQSNYMASNAFMDSFAGYRRRHGLPATSLALGQILDVGIVSYHPQYQENLLRMGLYGNTEAEFLQYCESAIRNAPSTAEAEAEDEAPYIAINKGHLMTGVEPAGLLSKSEKYPIRDMSWYRDPRFASLVQSTQHLSAAASITNTTNEAEGSADDETDTAINRIHRKLARLLYIAVEDIDVDRPIKSYGIDSMVAAELRKWLFNSFGTDVSLLGLLNPSMSITKLMGEVSKKESTGRDKL